MSLINLVQEDTKEFFGTSPGYRLYKLEVFNWGTFDDKVWTFSPQCETALLTGDVGSGKSTLVDALTTLLVSPRKVAYNKAADSSARERSITSYVRGYFGQKRSSEGMGQPDSLRDTSRYSVLLATFMNQELSQYVTLAQFFWFQDAQKLPARFYVVAEREMWIAQDFSRFERDIRVLKKRLKHSNRVQVFEDYARYAEVFRRMFGNLQEQALDLFQQTISMKKVEALTEFVRANMLEIPNTSDDVDKLIRHFHDLNCAHDAVIKAKNQVQQLKPIVEQGIRCGHLNDEQNTLWKARKALDSWFSEQMVSLQSIEIAKMEQDLLIAVAEREQADLVMSTIESNIQDLLRAIYSNGGDVLEQLKKDIQNSKGILERIRKNLQNYNIQTNKLKLPLATSIEIFMNNRRKLPELKSAEERLQGQINEDFVTAATEEKRSEKELKQVTEELESLRSRKSSIPREYIEKRKQLCNTLKIEEAQLPFVGELIEVREEEESWEGATERLLHNFAISILVPEEHYSAVMQWVDKTWLGIRLVYYRVQLDKVQPFCGQPNPLSVSEKLNIRPDTPFGIWLTKELRQRFTHVCCESMEQFRREPQAITKSGQIKTQGNRHEKDDRSEINDRRRFVLGFSNQKKIAVIEENERVLKEEVLFYKEEAKKAREQQNTSQDRLNTINGLESITDFNDIDTKSKEQEIFDMEQRKNKLENDDNVLKGLQLQLKTLEDKKISQKDAQKKTQTIEITLKNTLDEMKSNNETAKTIAKEATLSMRENEYPYLELHKTVALENAKISIKNIKVLERRYFEWIENKRSEILTEIDGLKGKIVRSMTEYNNKYPEETKEIDSSYESISEYQNILAQLEKDGLPKFELRFKQLLHENTINQIALFQAKLKQEQDTIKSRIEQINSSLNTIDYNEGRYIRLEYDETYDTDIKDFRIQLKACTEGALTGSEAEQYAEVKFMQVKAIIERFRGRPGETDSDERWTKKVIDVRNWFLFAASERWRETNEEYEHYTDSGGKSGGQKEKLAYTILAASLVYHFGLEGQEADSQSFRFVVIDEAFLKSSDESARFGLELFRRLDLQLLIVTPLLKIPTIAQFIAHVGFVHHDDITHKSMLRNISIEEYEHERKIREVAQYVKVV